MIIVSLVLLSICLLQVSHAVPYPVWRAAADYLFLRAKGGFPAGMIQNLVKLNSLALFCITQMVDEELLASLSLELLAVDFYNRVHLL